MKYSRLAYIRMTLPLRLRLICPDRGICVTFGFLCFLLCTLLVPEDPKYPMQSAAALILAFVATARAQDCPAAWTCAFTTTPPTLDADVSDWDSVNGITTSLLMITGETYASGDASYKCVYDDELIYFALEIPGDYRYSDSDNALCAAIATMMKIGSQATYVNMGGCPDALASGCNNGPPDTCVDYLVDIGAHWELAGVEQSVEYPIPGESNAISDEYAAAPQCRFGDDFDGGDSEWAGAWAHTNPVEGGTGTYIFELSRPLATNSSITDGQMMPGETYSFGVAFWDPFQLPDFGWTDAGHYVTGCGTNWIDLELASDAPGPAPTSTDPAPTSPGPAPTSTDPAPTSTDPAPTASEPTASEPTASEPTASEPTAPAPAPTASGASSVFTIAGAWLVSLGVVMATFVV